MNEWVDRADTQPTKARWVPVPDSTTNILQRAHLGGTKVGNGAWGLTWVDTVMEVDKSKEALHQYMMKQVEEAERLEALAESQRHTPA